MSIRLLEHMRDELIATGIVQNTPEFCRSWLGRSYDTGFAVADEKLAEMQDRAHRYCFIANTLADSVEINIR